MKLYVERLCRVFIAMLRGWATPSARNRRSAGSANAGASPTALDKDQEAHPAPGQIKAPGDADGRIERAERGWLVGWAHDVSFQPARVGVYFRERLLFAWPSVRPRGDLTRKGIGSGRHGFKIPLALLLPDAKPAELAFKILPSGKPLSAKVDILAEAFAGATFGAEDLPETPLDAEHARKSIIRCLAQSAAQANATGSILLDPAFLDELLNRLSATNAKLLQIERYIGHMEARAQSRHRDDNRAERRHLWNGRTGQRLAALAAQTRTLTSDALVERIESEIIPAYRENRHERAFLRDAISDSRDTKLLRALTKAFRKHDFIHAPAQAYQRSLDVAAKVEPSNFRYLSNIVSWSQSSKMTDPRRLRPLVNAGRAKRRALYVLWRGVPYDTNGYATRSHYLLRSLLQIGEDVIAVTRFGYPWDAEQAKSPESQIETIDGVLYVHLGGRDANRSTMALDEYVAECADRIAMVALQAGADIIHAASNWQAALPALQAARSIGLPFSYEIRGLWEITRASNVPGYNQTDHFDLFHFMEAYVAKEADKVFAITRQVRNEMSLRGVDPSRVSLAPNGVEVARFSPEKRDDNLAQSLGIGDETIFGYIGTFANYEGLLDLCSAAMQVGTVRSDFKILLIGGGPVFPQVKAFCATNDQQGVIILRERVPFEDVPRYYSLVDVAVFPRSPVEITEMVSPLKPFEAMAMGKPVIGSNVAAIAEIIEHGKTGWLFQKGDVQALASALVHALDNAHELEAFGAAAREFVTHHHDWQVIAGRIARGWTSLRD